MEYESGQSEDEKPMCWKRTNWTKYDYDELGRHIKLEGRVKNIILSKHSLPLISVLTGITFTGIYAWSLF